MDIKIVNGRRIDEDGRDWGPPQPRLWGFDDGKLYWRENDDPTAGTKSVSDPPELYAAILAVCDAYFKEKKDAK